MPRISRISNMYLKDKRKWVSMLLERGHSKVKKVEAEERQGGEGRGGEGREGRKGEGRGKEGIYMLDQTRQPPSALQCQLFHELGLNDLR